MNSTYVAGQNVMYNKPRAKKKKAPKNSFSFYLDDAIKELRRNGQHVANKAEAVPIVSEKWKNMSPAEKAPYEEKARAWKIQQKQQPKSGRLDCTGYLIDERVNMEEFAENKRKQARKMLSSQWPTGHAVCDVHFYLISFQSLFELPNEEGYQPCEVACIDYTLNQGINRVWHQFIDPGPIKLGMRAEIRIFSEKTHQIPEEGFELASDQYHMIWQDLLHFLKPNKKSSEYPPLICKMSEMTKTLFCLDWLSAHAGMSNQLSKIFEMEDAVAELYKHGGMMRPSLTNIEDGCSSHMYDYEANTTCSYHEERECVHCAELTVKKCCYYISDSLSKVYGFEITDKHLPVKKAPTFTIIRPDKVMADTRPLRSRSDNRSSYSIRQYESPSTGEESTYGSRDIRYRPTYAVVPSRLECTDVDSATVDTGSPPTRSYSAHASGPSHPTMISGDRRSEWRPRNRLAANFHIKPKASQENVEGDREANDDLIDSLSQDFDAASISSAVTSEGDESGSRQVRRTKLGRGRGLANYMK